VRVTDIEYLVTYVDVSEITDKDKHFIKILYKDKRYTTTVNLYLLAYFRTKLKSP